METEDARQVVVRLSGSVWAFSALCYAAEKGILDQLNEPRTLSYISERTGVPITLVECILDILVALNLARREGDMVSADKGLLSLITPPSKTFFLANLRANYFESRDFIDSGKKPTVELGWNFTEPEVLQSEGLASAIASEFLFGELSPRLGDLTPRLQAPSGRFLDVGTGVGAISIAACRSLPNLHVVGLEPQDAALTVARRNITAAGLTDRIELRKQCVEDMADKEVFDFAYFPQCFMSFDVVKRGLRNIWRALRPGGWITVTTVCVPGVELQTALSRLRDMLFGGGGLIPAQVEAMLSDAGFTSVATFKFPRGATVNIIAGQRPI